MQFIKQIIGLALVIGVGFVLFNLAKQSDSNPKDFSVGPDNTAEFTGTVLANITSCFDTNTGKCFLKIKSGEADVYVIYNTNDSDFCKNEAAISTGRNTAVGSLVRVHGFYKQENETHTILTCPNNDYYIKPF
jgi:hypothetical protein